ncbi:hypothetical protein J5N97_017954 [Dioscorea zingiberensis]|uniref:Probable purine permease n=1 Tax=Dioscorea zingiberensis TaxID=325984 RepID=A0A9D5CMY5_9LILI|nr:hypothetical protein J5N97_017954 [Dioscorea zingiberensis]
MLLGSGGPLLLRLYFLHGGKRLWLASFLQVSGWPLTLLPLLISYLGRRRRRPCSSGDKLILLPPAALAACSLLGLLIGLDSYLYAIGSSYLPLSTSSLVSSSQLAFTAVFAAVIVRQRLTASAVNSVVLLTMGPVVLSLEGGGGERMEEEEEVKGTSGRYGEGLLMTVAAAALMGVLLPLMELIWLKVKKDQRVRYGLVMEMQLVMGLSASLFCLLGIILNQDFKAMRKEAKDLGIGEMKYYMILLLDVIFWQALNIGLVGLVSGASSLLGGILMAVQLPVSVILSLIFFKEKFQSGKGVALALSIWGFISYLYGEMKQSKKLKQMVLDQDNQQSLSVP